MRVVLVGADFEENLGMGMIAAAAQQAGHVVHIVPFNYVDDEARTVEAALARAPDVIGLSMQFQHRAGEFLGLSRALRDAGFAGHITCGGQFPTLAVEQVLCGDDGVDSIVLHEGERAFPEMLEALGLGQPLAAVPGLALRDERGCVARTAARRLLDDLDELPFATRYRPHVKHVGVPFVPIMGGRGCWGSCAYCSITSFYRDARAQGGGRTLRWRSPENIAAEMALLAGECGGEAIFCFHDDTFLLPKPSESLARVRGIRTALEPYGLERIAMIGKCRPDSMTPELARSLRELGVIRLYVGIENAAEKGATHLGRATQWGHIDTALSACRDAGIFVCYNLLIFEPETTLEDVRTNVRFIRDHAEHPINFCRAEPYVGTPLEIGLTAGNALAGNFLGWSYSIHDPTVEVLFRICASAFRARNFASDGVANRYMGLGYALKLLEYFYDDPEGTRASLARRVRDTTRGISRETADFLARAMTIVEQGDIHDADRIERETALLGLDIAAADARWQGVLDELYTDMDTFAARRAASRTPMRMPRELLRAARKIAIGATIAASAACTRERPTMLPVDPPPPPPGGNVMMVDPVPPPYDSGPVLMPPDPVPPPMVVDPPPPPMVMDPVPMPPDPVPSPRPPRRRDAGVPRVMPPDPVPRPPRVMPPDPVPHPIRVTPPMDPVPSRLEKPDRLPVLIDQWRDTTPRTVERARELPLACPPEISLEASRDGEFVRVLLRGATVDTAGMRWQASGRIEGEGTEVRWRPSSIDDALRVAVRTRGGVSIASVRAREVRGA